MRMYVVDRIEPTRITDKTLYDSYMGIRAYHEDVIVAQLKKEVRA